MWLLLAAAGTGYLARCWQKARKRKSASSAFRHNASVCVSQRSPSSTPRRGRSTNASHRGSRKRSQSAKSRKLLSGRSEGRPVRNHAMDGDLDLGSSEKFFEELLWGYDGLPGQSMLSGSKNQDMVGEVQSSDLHRNNHMEHYLSLSSMCMQDHWKEKSSCSEQPLLITTVVDAKESLFCNCVLSNKKPIFETLHGCSATTLDFVKSQLNMVALSSRKMLDCSKPVENCSITGDVECFVSPSCVKIPRIKAAREGITQNYVYKPKGSTEQSFGFFTKLARELGLRTYSSFTSKFSTRMQGRSGLKPSLSQNSKKGCVCWSLFDGNLWNNIYEKERCLSLQNDKHGSNSCAVHSHLLKALLDPEYLEQCHRCKYFTISIRGNHHEDGVPCLIHDAGLSMPIDRKRIQNVGGKSEINHSKCSKGQTTRFTKPPNPNITRLLGSNETSLVALGVAMGVAFVACGRNNEFEDLHKLLQKMNLSIEELRKQMDSKFEFDLLKLIKVKKDAGSVPSKLTVPNETCPWNAHQPSESNSSKSAAEISLLELLSVDDNHTSNVLLNDHAHGLNELEAELEAELQLMEHNACNANFVDYKQKQTQSIQENWLPGGDDGLYVDIDFQDSMAVQDVEQLYESDLIVPPLELERRLWQVLEQRHEERICELENDLHVMSEKVTAKELEVQWWKDRVWWLMETALSGKNDDTQSWLFE